MVFWKPNKENISRKSEWLLRLKVDEKLCALSIGLGFGKGCGKGELSSVLYKIISGVVVVFSLLHSLFISLSLKREQERNLG